MVSEATLTYDFDGAFWGASTFHFESAISTSIVSTTMTNLVNDFVASGCAELSCAWDGELRDMDTGTGQLVGVFNLTPVSATSSNVESGAGVPDQATFAMGMNTAGLVEGKRVKGRTFFSGIPDVAIQFGELELGFRTGLTTSLTTNGLVVWSRPKYDRTDPENPVLVRPGSEHDVIGWTPGNGEVNVMRSRRRK